MLTDNELFHQTSTAMLIAEEGATYPQMCNSPVTSADGEGSQLSTVVASAVIEQKGEPPMHFLEWSCGCEDVGQQFGGPMFMIVRSPCCPDHELPHQ